MNRDELVLAVAGSLLAVGLAIAWSGFHHEPGPTRRRSVHRAPVVAGVVGASLVVVVSGWIIPSFVVGIVVGWMVDSMHRGPAGLDAGVERTEALASWVENVRDVLQSGNQPIGAIGATTETCPPSIRPHVRVLFARLAVFSGWFRLHAIRACCATGVDDGDIIDLVGGLVDKSLVIADHQRPTTRYRLLETVRAYAETGADYLSVGAITHSAPALDLSLEIEEVG